MSQPTPINQVIDDMFALTPGLPPSLDTLANDSMHPDLTYFILPLGIIAIGGGEMGQELAKVLINKGVPFIKNPNRES